MSEHLADAFSDDDDVGVPPAAAEPVAALRGVSHRYGRKARVLDDVSLSIAGGGITMILGASGSGKTTLLKVLKGLTRPEYGDVSVLGRAVVAGAGRWRLDPRVAYIPQQLGLVRGMPVSDAVLTGALGRVPRWRGLLGLFPADVVAECTRTLASLGIAAKEHEKVRNLSGGERQRVAIARALMQRPQLILADEFVSQLDPATTAETMVLVRDIVASGATMIMTTHELDLVERFADRVVVLQEGRVVLDRPASQVTADELARVMKA